MEGKSAGPFVTMKIISAEGGLVTMGKRQQQWLPAFKHLCDQRQKSVITVQIHDIWETLSSPFAHLAPASGGQVDLECMNSCMPRG